MGKSALEYVRLHPKHSVSTSSPMVTMVRNRVLRTLRLSMSQEEKLDDVRHSSIHGLSDASTDLLGSEYRIIE